MYGRKANFIHFILCLFSSLSLPPDTLSSISTTIYSKELLFGSQRRQSQIKICIVEKIKIYNVCLSVFVKLEYHILMSLLYQFHSLLVYMHTYISPLSTVPQIALSLRSQQEVFKRMKNT